MITSLSALMHCAKRRWILCALFTASVIAACTDLGMEASPIYFSDNIRETVFRYLFGDNPSGLQQNASTYYLSFCDVDTTSYVWVWTSQHDPPDAFMERFGGNNPPVKEGSRCSQRGIVLDLDTGKRGLLCLVGNIVSLNNENVKVYAGYYEGLESSSLGTYYLTRKNGSWVVTRWSLIFIS